MWVWVGSLPAQNVAVRQSLKRCFLLIGSLKVPVVGWAVLPVQTGFAGVPAKTHVLPTVSLMS